MLIGCVGTLSGENSFVFITGLFETSTDRPKAVHASGDAAREDAAEGGMGKGAGLGDGLASPRVLCICGHGWAGGNTHL